MKTIIAATDFSVTSGAALRVATKFAKTMNARVLLVFVQDTTDIRYALGQEIPLKFENSAELKTELSKHFAKRFNDFIRKFGNGYSKVNGIILRGVPWQQINKLCHKMKADLIVVGSRGFSPLKTLFVGSTTQNLIRTSTCPVLVIHKSKRKGRKKEAA